MMQEDLRREVEERVGKPLDAEGLRVFEATLHAVLKRGVNLQVPSQEKAPSLIFQGENISLEEYERLPDDQKVRYAMDAQERNREWLEQKFRELQASWLMVVDGQVVAYGSPEDYPSDEEFLELCRRTGKEPFIFDNPFELLIEESGGWHPTMYSPDHYPTVKVILSSAQGSLGVEADLDAGARAVYADFNLLQSAGVLPLFTFRRAQGHHLGLPYEYTRRRLRIELTDEAGITRRVEWQVYCVFDWARSPFVLINPSRQSLVGRGVLLRLQPKIELDFRARLTEVHHQLP